ncbi:MAG: CHASE2 domain-containing protein [Verrucomicrobia bacterium]|nr:CHASE2 domain-containing protein [Verrucomicrobiota bacterium]
MALTQTTRARCFVALLLAAGVTLLGVALKETFSAASYDLLHSLSQISGGRFSDDRVVIIYLDLASFLLAKQNPADRWPRQFHAQLLDRLTADGARAAVFDILFDSPGDNPAADAALADALKKNSRAVLAAEHNDKNSHATSAAAERARIATLRPPEKLFADAAAAWGVAALEVDDSFVVRRHLPAFGGERTASLSLAAARFLGATNMSGAELWLRYYGPAITLPHVSYSEALDPAALPSGFFRDKIVFIGARPTVGFMDAKQDEFRNPFHSWANKEFFMPGVEVHATQLLNWLRGDALKRHSNTGENLLLLLAALIFGGGLPWLRPAAATVAAGIGAVAVLAASLAVFSANVWFPWLAIVAAQIPAALFGSWLWQFQEWFLTRRKLEAAKRITDAKIREQAALLDKAQDAILVQSLEGRILYANPSAERLFGAANVSPSPLKGERAGVRGATVEGHQKASMASNEPAHPSPSITLSSEGKGKSEAARWEISDVFSADPFTAD